MRKKQDEYRNYCLVGMRMKNEKNEYKDDCEE